MLGGRPGQLDFGVACNALSSRLFSAQPQTGFFVRVEAGVEASLARQVVGMARVDAASRLHPVDACSVVIYGLGR